MAGTIGKSKSISGFDPRSIPGCVLWLDGADSSTITLSSSSVSQWSDKSGYGLHAVASGISSATLPIQGTMNGLSTVRFSASGYTALKTPLILPLTNSFGGGASYFVVGQATSSSASSGGRILVSDSQVRQFIVSGTPPAYLQAYSGVNPASFTASIQASVPFVASIVEGNGTMTSYVNGIANATTSATTALTSASFYIGSATTVGNNFDGDIGEILIFQNTLTSIQQQQIEAYLFWKWSVVATAFPTALTPYVWYDASISGNLGTTAIAGVNGANSSLNGDASGGGGGGYYGGGATASGGGGGWSGGGGSGYVGGLTGTVVNTQGGGAAGVTGISSAGNNGSVSITANGTTTNFSYTGGYQTYTVPGGVTSLTVTASGASGGGATWASYSGAGGFVSGTLAVTPGQILTIVVGGGGGAPNGINGAVPGGFRGGGSGAGYPQNGWYAGGGGGWSGIINQSQTVAYCIAGGGGGAGGGSGGAGGGTTGATGVNAGGGSQTSGGTNNGGGITAGIWSNTSGSLYNWFDSGASARNATQAVVGSVPTWTSSVQNGLGGLLFSGGQCYNLPTLTSLNPISIFVVAKATSFTSGAMILSLTGSTGIYFRSTNGASNPTYTSYGVDYGSSSYRYVPNSAVTDTNTHLWGFVLPASGLGTFTFDGVVGNAASGFTTSQIGTTYTTASIGAYGQNAASNPFTGYIFEVIIFNSALSTVQRQLIEGYLNKKWAIYSVKNSIISTNPYYAIQPYSRPFNPLDIDGLQVWMDAADSTTITGSSPVTQWNDKSGNGYNFTASAGPVLATSSQNGLNTLTFTAASSQFLSNTATVNFMEFYSLSVFAAFKYSDTTSAGYVFAKSLYGVANGRILFGRDAGTPATFNAGITTTANAYSTYSDAYTANTWRVYGFVADRSAGTVKAYQNGSNNASGTFTVDTTTNLTTAYPMAIGAYNNSSGTLASPQAGLYFNGSLGELLVYNSALSFQQRQQIEGYLARKWAITLSNTFISSTTSATINVSFSYVSDAIQTWVVPAGVTSLTNVTVNGAGGYNGYQQNSAGRGASVVGTLTVTPGATLSIYVGRCGTVVSGYFQTSTGGWPGGGSANNGEEGGGGGGYSAIANNPVTTYYVIAGAGGGGTGYGGTGGDGGANGSSGTSVNGNNPATGGTQSAGGAGTGGGSSGGYLTGGNASSATYNGGGGGAGYYGGGGGPGGGAGGLLGGGGGGSSLTSGPGFTLTSVTTGGGGARNTNGSVSFSYTGPVSVYSPHPFGIIPTVVDGQFSPLNLSGLTTLWLDAADSSTIQFGTGSAVYQWFDKSGNNNHVWQPTAINQPTYGLDTTYQKYGIQFVNAANTVLIPQNTTKSPVSAVNSYSIFIVARFSDPAISTAQTLLYTNTGTYTEYIQLSSGTLTTTINEVSVTASKTSATASGIYSIIAGSSLATFINGVSIGSTLRTAPVSHSLNFWIGAQSASAGEMSGTIFEIIVLNCSPSTALQQKIEGYLANKWAPLLASTHPYYKFAPSASPSYIAPSAPSSVSLSSLSGSGGTISWGAGATAGIGYQWYVGTALGSGVIASGTVASGTLTVNFTASLSEGTTYYGWVISYNSLIVSARVYSLGLVYSTSLYVFSSFTFTNCGAIGKNGPAVSACRTTYATSWASNSLYLDMTTNGYQLWTAPQTTNYTIICAGAGQICNGYGYGAIVGATASLTSGTKYQILVGQSGSNATSYSAGAGGSFFASGITPATGVCIVAGGGAGGYYYTYGASSQNGTNSTSGNTSGNGTLGGSSGAGGVAPDYYGHSGAGFIGNGSNSVTGYGGAIASLSFQNGGVGGTDGGNPSVVGGFGGGGGINWGYGGGGGGGGYSGGGGGQQNFGGGGGSFPSGVTLLGLNSGQGFVSVYPYVYSSAPTGGTVSLSSFTGTSVIITIGAATNGLLYNYYITTSGSSIVGAVYTGLSGTAGAISLSLTINSGTTYYGAIVPANVQGTGSTVFSIAYNIPGTTTVTLSSITGSGGTLSWTAATNASGYLWYVGTGYGTGTIVSGNISGTTTTFSYSMTNSYYYGWVQPYSATANGSIFYSPPVFYTNATGNLYAFSSFVFTNAAAIYQNGPTLAQCQTAYSGTAWATGGTYLTMTTQGYQLWSVPTTGTYTFVVGGSACGSNSPTYGYGAIIGTTLSLQIGQQLQILVGQMAQTGGGSGSIGGGGGTFVASGVTPSGANCLIAAGGGGGYQTGITWANQNASYTLSGNASSDGSAGGTNGNGGAAGQGYGHSGAGFIGNGSNSTQYFIDGQIVAFSFKNGGTGGKDGTGIWGGFGGGGGVNAGWYGGGGGGGYSGGGGAGTGSPAGVGGGGGSFPSGATQLGFNQLNGFCYVYYGTFSSVPTGGAISITSFTSTTVSINITAATNAILYDYYITTSGSSIVSPVFMGTTVLTGTISILVTTTPGSTYYAALTSKNTFGSATTIFSGAYPVPGTSTISITSLSSSSCTLSWTVSTNANSYTWAIGTSTTSTSYTGTTSGTSVTFSGSFSTGTYYYARVIPSSSSVTGVAYHTGGFQISGAATYAVVEYTQTYVVPSGKTSISITMSGAGGGGGGYQTGGAGALVTGTLSVTAGTTYYIIVGAGGKGSAGSVQSSVRAFGGGGIATPGQNYCGNGGGRSAIQLTLGTDLLDAGGGGGSGYGQGGSGGANGTAGTNSGGGTGGSGGTQSSGGANYTGTDGSAPLSGGGAGGFFGGLGGNSSSGSYYGGGGGGGSSLTSASGFTLTAVTTGGGGAAGSYYGNGGDGYITIT